MFSITSKLFGGWTDNKPNEPPPPTIDNSSETKEENAENASAPFEGPEKLLEIWFAPSAEAVEGAADSTDGKFGLRKVERKVWEGMLDIVKCKVLNFIQGEQMDAYLLSESSLFISPHKLILKTCGTTLNLYGLPRILSIAQTEASFPTVHRVFYSRKSFMFPERQLGPHRDWKYEVEYLDKIFPGMGAAYTVGKVNGDHWLLYMTTPPSCSSGEDASGGSLASCDEGGMVFVKDVDLQPTEPATMTTTNVADYTIEILMSDLSPKARANFYAPPELLDTADSATSSSTVSPLTHGQELSARLGITDIFSSESTTLDAYTFSPCGYSANALIKWAHPPFSSSSSSSPFVPSSSQSGEGYYTIHVTPESGWSYASFECNVPLSHLAPSALDDTPPSKRGKDGGGDVPPDLITLIKRVVSIFEPGRLSLTVFVASEDDEGEERGESAVESAQRAFRCALMGGGGETKRRYKRTDKINYEFGGYDLAFASFELR